MILKRNNMRPIGLLILAFLVIQCEKQKSGQDWTQVMTNQGLVDIQSIDSSIVVDLAYSDTSNFFGKDVYGDYEKAFAQPIATKMLVEANARLKEINPDLRLKIYDSVRPRSIQWILWNSSDMPEDERRQYIAHPESGSIHNYGLAIDLTISDSEGNELDMGTGYDDFRELAHIDKEEELVSEGKLTNHQVENRLLLRKVMTEAGFLTIRSEWWHFDALPRAQVLEEYVIIE